MTRWLSGTISPRAAALAAIAVAFIPMQLLISQVEAAVLPVLTPVADPPGTPFLAPEAALGSDWVSYQLDLQSTAGEQIRAVEVRIHGQLHQGWTDSDGDGVPDSTPNAAASDGRGDSHITATGNVLFGRVPSENNSGIGSPLADNPGVTDYGIGGTMQAAWGYLGNPAPSSANVAYFVVPRDPDPSFKFHIDAADSNGNILAELDSECPGYVCAGPNIDLVGNGYNIADGDSTPSLLDGTDFGTVPKGSVQNRLFTMYPGSIHLVTGPVTVTGPFTAGRNPFFPERFAIQLNTQVPGNYLGTISFPTNDPLAPIFNFSVAAHVVPEPASIALVGLALVGFACAVRRRSSARGPARSTFLTGSAKSIAVAFFSVVMLSTSAEAAVIGTATLVRQPPGVPFASPDAALPAPWVGYSLGLQTTAGELIAGIDVTIQGTLHQRWVFNEDLAVFLPTPNSANQSNGDSHLRAPAQIGFNGPSEDNSGNGSPLADTLTSDYGVGSFLSGTWGVTNATTANLAYIVIPSGSEPLTDIRVLVGNPQGDIIGELTSRDFPGFMPPEFPPVVGDLTVRRSFGFPVPILTATLPVSDDSPLDELTWNLDSFTGPNPPLNPPTVDPATGLFTWNFNGAQLGGTYEAVIRATDAFGLSDTGILTILPAPEPTCMTLLGLALIGLTGTFRHRLTSRR